MAPAALMAQYSADPLNGIYADFDQWEGAGYLRDMPPFRPYPEPVLIAALQRVARVGDAEARETAQRYLDRLNRTFDIEWQVTQETRTDGDNFHVKGALGAVMQGRLSDSVTLAGSVTGLLLDMEDGELLPRGRRTQWDILDDWSSIPLGGRDVAALNQVNTSFAWGRESLYLHAGIMRRSFGPLHDDGVVWSSYAHQSPNLVVSWQHERFRYSFGLFSLTATRRYRELTPFDELDGSEARIIDDTENLTARLMYDPDEYPGKWVFVHDFRYSPFDWLTVAFFESATWGPHLELAYLVPLKWGFNAQGNSAFAGSSKMGVSAEFRPRRDLSIPVIAYVDDANFNQWVRFNFDSKLKIALHTAVVWTPFHSLVRRVALDYVAVSPYTYTHDGEYGMFGTEPIYTNYTHQGLPIGPDLRPNSDRLTLSTTLRPAPRFALNLQGRMIRHGNASADVDGLGTVGHDGSIFDDGRYYRVAEDGGRYYINSGRLSFQERLDFLNQDLIERTYQLGFDLDYTIPLRRSRLILSGGYQFEHVSGPLSFQATDQTITVEEPLAEEKDFILYRTVAGPDQTNHYVQFKVRYAF